MPVIQEMSDLHFEFYPDEGQAFIRELDPSGVDILVLAGDIIPATKLARAAKVFKAFCERYKLVFFVPGNHEFYKTVPPIAENIFKACEAEIPNFRYLDNRVVEVDGTRFLGGTMWFKDAPRRVRYSHDLNDFDLIRHFVPWVFDKNSAFQTFLQENLRKDDVVITHHLPSYRSVPPDYKDDPLNIFFVCDQERLIDERQPKLWIHGHTHFTWDYQLGETRVLCNPRGYPRDWRAEQMFVKRLLIEV